MTEQNEHLRILSFGAGAIGTYIGGSLAIAGNQIVYIEQPAMVEKLKISGIKVDLKIDPRRQDTTNFEINQPQVQFVSTLDEALKFGEFDVALFALKSFDTETVLQNLGENVSKLPPILCLQNGVDNEEVIAKYVGNKNVIYGTVTSAVGRKDVGNIVLEKLRGVGIAAGHPLSERLVREMNSAFLNARLFTDPRSMKWSKMLTNLLANATSAILNLTPAEIFSDPVLAKIEVDQIRECLAVMKKLGIKVVDLPGTPVKMLSLAAILPTFISKPFLQKAVGSGRGAKMPSFHIDLHSGRKKSEVDFLNGAVVRQGKACGVETPVNSVLSMILVQLTNGELPISEYDHLPNKLNRLISTK